MPNLIRALVQCNLIGYYDLTKIKIGYKKKIDCLERSQFVQNLASYSDFKIVAVTA